MTGLTDVIEEGVNEICEQLITGIGETEGERFFSWDPEMEDRFQQLRARYGELSPLLTLAATSYFLGFVVLFFSKNQEVGAETLLKDEKAAELFTFFAALFERIDTNHLNFSQSTYSSPRAFLEVWLIGDAPFSARTAKENFFLDLCIRFDHLQGTTLSSRLMNDIRYLLYSLALADEQVSEQEQELIDFLDKEAEGIRASIGDTRQYDIHARDNHALLAEAKAELEELIGLDSIKYEIIRLESFLRIQNIREEKNLAVADLTLHFVFHGNPGTGKTTVARIIGKIFKGIGFLKQGQVVETDRSGLVAEYLGQTAMKTKKVVESALDGILFIDEAYALSRGSAGGNDNFGREAIETVLKLMEDYRRRLVVVVAGYPRLMEDFIDTNPGLKSRFTRYLTFEDFSPEELLSIIHLFASKTDYLFSEEADQALSVLLTRAWEEKEEGFGNARYVRNLFQEIIQNQAMRLAREEKIPGPDLLTRIEIVDLPEEGEQANED